jgi:hypothetical protein
MSTGQRRILLVKLGAQLPEWAVKQKAGEDSSVGRAVSGAPPRREYSKSGAEAAEPIDK